MSTNAKTHINIYFIMPSLLLFLWSAATCFWFKTTLLCVCQCFFFIIWIRRDLWPNWLLLYTVRNVRRNSSSSSYKRRRRSIDWPFIYDSRVNAICACLNPINISFATGKSNLFLLPSCVDTRNIYMHPHDTFFEHLKANPILDIE